MRRSRALLLLPSVLLLFSPLCIAADAPPLKSGIDRATFDTSVRPGEDFFLYVNGHWNQTNPIPAEYSRWGSFPKLRDDNLAALRRIVEDAAEHAGSKTGDDKKIGDFYRSAINQAARDRDGASALAPEFEAIAKLTSPQDLPAMLAHFHSMGIPVVFSFSVSPDARQSDRYAAHLHQGGLGLPERGYYVGDTDDSKRVRAKYREHVAAMLVLLGDSPQAAHAAADALLAIETKLAEASRTPVQLRDREAQYNKHTREKLAELTPKFDWNVYFKSIDVTPVNEVIVGQPKFFERVNELLSSTPIADWQAYLRWHLIHAAAPYLSAKLENEEFHFFSEDLRGVKEMQPNWKRALGTLDRQMGEAVGRLYVEKHFTPAAKQRMDDLVKNILVAYRQRIETRDWMGAETKKQALAKLEAIALKVGYPKVWRDYSPLQIKGDSYVGNALRSQQFEVRRRLSRLGKSVDRNEWGMTPPTVNAYYNSTMNEIVFPAGILQSPFFDPTADDAVNYGAIGAIIGHEITHGFDDQGSRSDGQGNLKNWWTDEDRARFNAKTEKLAAQYDACIAVADQHVNGHLTLGENIADLGGVAIAYAAYQKSLDGHAAPVIDGFTGPQRFFIGFAQVWRGAVRDADQRLLLRTDPHSPGRFRTLIPLSNVQAFYDAFDMKPGDAMYRAPGDRVEIW
jgi:putative endopeptidase